jgi:cyclomaltodextrinase / maltogenic alpha-amylase / neopullulanase
VDDFIFGTLATDELRLNHERALRAGVTHNHNRLPRDPTPGQPVELHLWVGPDHPVTQAWVYWTADGNDPDGESGVARHGFVLPMQHMGSHWDTLLWGYRQHWRAVLPEQPAGIQVRYRLSVCAPNEDEIFADGGAYYAFYIAVDPLPEWTRQVVVYQIFVDRFFPGEGIDWLTPKDLSGFYGGTLEGIRQKLDYIQTLGANTLWLSPVFPSPTHHGYDPTDYFEIEPRLGSKNDFRLLLEDAHARQMRILLDFIPNHCSHLHSAFQDAISDPGSRYLNWFSFSSWPDEYKTFFGVKSLPQLNLRDPQARQNILDAAAYWLDFGVDGYRVDYAIGPTQDFWADFRQVTRTVKPDCWTFGEVVDPPDMQLSFEGLLDGCLDFMLLEAFRETFAFGRWNAQRFAAFLDRHESYFPSNFSRPSFLDNHDMNRFLWAARGDMRRLKLAALCQFTLSGPPVIYQGTEIGLSQARDIRQEGYGFPEEARQPMLWGVDQDMDLFGFYQGLIRNRMDHECLRIGDRQLIHQDHSSLAYIRESDSDQLLILLHLEDESKSLRLPGTWTSVHLSTGPAIGLVHAAGQTEVTLPPLSGAILAPGENSP